MKWHFFQLCCLFIKSLIHISIFHIFVKERRRLVVQVGHSSSSSKTYTAWFQSVSKLSGCLTKYMLNVLTLPAVYLFKFLCFTFHIFIFQKKTPCCPSGPLLGPLSSKTYTAWFQSVSKLSGCLTKYMLNVLTLPAVYLFKFLCFTFHIFIFQKKTPCCPSGPLLGPLSSKTYTLLWRPAGILSSHWSC